MAGEVGQQEAATTSTDEAEAEIEIKSASERNSIGADALNRDAIEDDRIYF